MNKGWWHWTWLLNSLSGPVSPWPPCSLLSGKTSSSHHPGCPPLLWSPNVVSHLELLAWSAGCEEHGLLRCPGAAAGPRRGLTAFDLQSWKQPWNAPGPEKMPKWNLFQDHAFPEGYSGAQVAPRDISWVWVGQGKSPQGGAGNTGQC